MLEKCPLWFPMVVRLGCKPAEQGKHQGPSLGHHHPRRPPDRWLQRLWAHVCPPKPQLWQTNARGKLHDPFPVHTEALTGVGRTHPPPHTPPCSSTLPFQQATVLTEPPAWKGIKNNLNEFKIHSCLRLTKPVSFYKERICCSNHKKRKAKEMGRLMSNHKGVTK